MANSVRQCFEWNFTNLTIHLDEVRHQVLITMAFVCIQCIVCFFDSPVGCGSWMEFIAKFHITAMCSRVVILVWVDKTIDRVTFTMIRSGLRFWAIIIKPRRFQHIVGKDDAHEFALNWCILMMDFADITINFTEFRVFVFDEFRQEIVLGFVYCIEEFVEISHRCPTAAAYRFRQMIVFADLKWANEVAMRIEIQDATHAERIFCWVSLTASEKCRRITPAIFCSIPSALKMSIGLVFCTRHKRHRFRLIYLFFVADNCIKQLFTDSPDIVYNFKCRICDCETTVNAETSNNFAVYDDGDGAFRRDAF